MSEFTIAQSTIDALGFLGRCNEEAFLPILSLGMILLEGDEIGTEKVIQLSQTYGLEEKVVAKVAQASADLIWEFSRATKRNSNSMVEILSQLAIPDAVVKAFSQTYRENLVRIKALKQSIGLSTLRFDDLSWRIDVELGRRNMAVVTDPKFLLRLDLKSTESSSTESFHLQADYANMKRMQVELQRALDELQSTHCQRLTRYIT